MLNRQFLARRTQEWCPQALPTKLSAQLGCLGCALVTLSQPFAACGAVFVYQLALWDHNVTTKAPKCR
jgi:hypothetical protein